MKITKSLILGVLPLFYCPCLFASLSSTPRENAKVVSVSIYRESDGIRQLQQEHAEIWHESKNNSLFSIGIANYEKGQYEKAKQDFEEASTKGHSGASYYLSLYYQEVEKNEEKATEYSSKFDEQLLEALKHQAKQERDQDFLITQGLSYLYIRSRGADREQVDNLEEIYDLEERSKDFLKDGVKDYWIVQGNSGSGKSLFGRHLEKKLLEERNEYIPLFIQLSQAYERDKDIKVFIEKNLISKGIPEQMIPHIKERKKFLFILDGYDEISGDFKASLKSSPVKDCQINKPGQWQGKIIVTCRTHYLSAADIPTYLYPSGDTPYQRANQCMESYFVPFSKEQIEEYIEKFCKSPIRKKVWQKNEKVDTWVVSDYQKAIDRFPEIKEFLMEPFLLYLILLTLPKLQEDAEHNLQKGTGPIRRINLYETFIKNWFDRQYDRLFPLGSKMREGLNLETVGSSNFMGTKRVGAENEVIIHRSTTSELAAPSPQACLSESDLQKISEWFSNLAAIAAQNGENLIAAQNGENLYDKALRIFDKYTQELAYEMLTQGKQAIIQPSPESKIFDSFFNVFEKNASGTQISRPAEEKDLGFQVSPLKRNKTTYLFMHKSFQEYFVAKIILNELNNLQKKEVIKKNIHTLRINEISFVPYPAIQQFVADKIHQDPTLKKLLFDIVKASRDKHA